MANKLNVVFSTMYFPVALGKYFEFALRRREDVNLFTVGPYTGTFIPWKGGIHLPQKYSQSPDLPLDKSFCGNTALNPKIVESQLPFKPDLWINADAGFAFRKPDCIYAIIATDPHCLPYTYQRVQADVFFNMQKVYSIPGDEYLPYCADPIWHSPLEREKEYDVCLVGLQYKNRTALVNRLRSRGLKVYYDTGPCYFEYRELYAKSKVAFSWSSKQDLIARVFENMLMAIPLVCNRVPDLPSYFTEDKHYYGFDTLDEAEQQIMRALDDYNTAMEMAWNAHKEVKEKHLYDHRITQILETVKLI